MAKAPLSDAWNMETFLGDEGLGIDSLEIFDILVALAEMFDLDPGTQTDRPPKRLGDLIDWVGGRSNETIDGSAARVDLGTEQLSTVGGPPRAACRPQLYVANIERDGASDPAVEAILR